MLYRILASKKENQKNNVINRAAVEMTIPKKKKDYVAQPHSD